MIDHFCRQCGARLRSSTQFCQQCGSKIAVSYESGRSVPISASARRWGKLPRNPDTIALTALVAGALSLWGIGHICVGKVGKGIAIMMLGWLVEGLLILTLLGLLHGPGFALVALFAGVVLGGWIFQAFDAYSLAKKLNLIRGGRAT